MDYNFGKMGSGKYSDDNVLCTFDTGETEMYLKKELECFSEHIQSVSSDGVSWFYKNGTT